MNQSLTHGITAYQLEEITNYDKDLGNSGPVLLKIWIYFNLIANNVLLPILLITALISRRPKRTMIFHNLCITWIFSGIFSLLLFYAGKYNDFEPPRTLCIAQASLMFGIAPMWSIAVLAGFYYVYRSFQGQSNRNNFWPVTWWSMVVGPYFFGMLFFLVALVIALRHRNLVSRQHAFFYCDLNSQPLLLTRTVFVAFCAGCTLTLEALMLRECFTLFYHIHRISPHQSAYFRQCVWRILIYGIYVLVGVAVDIIAVVHRQSVLPQIYIATAGAFVFIVFGIHKDILRIWFPFQIFWREKPKRASNRSYRTNFPAQPSVEGNVPYRSSLGRHGVDGRELIPQHSSSSVPSFTLDDLLPIQQPEPAHTVPVPLHSTHCSI